MRVTGTERLRGEGHDAEAVGQQVFSIFIAPCMPRAAARRGECGRTRDHRQAQAGVDPEAAADATARGLVQAGAELGRGRGEEAQDGNGHCEAGAALPWQVGVVVDTSRRGQGEAMGLARGPVVGQAGETQPDQTINGGSSESDSVAIFLHRARVWARKYLRLLTQREAARWAPTDSELTCSSATQHEKQLCAGTCNG